MKQPDVRDYLMPTVDAAGRVADSATIRCGRHSVVVQVAPAMSGQWQYRELAKVLQPVLDKVFKEGRCSAGEKHAGTSGTSA